MPPKMTRLRLLILILGMSLTSAAQSGTTAPLTEDVFPNLSRIPVLPLRPLGPATDAPQVGQGEGESGAFPDAASTSQPPVEKKCGPWKCWDFPNRPLKDVVSDKRWILFTSGFVAATAFDYTVTRIGLDQGKCSERNPNLGQDPSAGTFAKDFAETHLPVIVLGTVMSKVLPKNGWASWIYPGMMTYGMQMHVRGAMSWYSKGCM